MWRISWPMKICFPLFSSDVRAAREQMTTGGPYPTLPLQDAPPRPPSVFSQHSSACSPTASFAGPFNPPGVVSPQPHSSYYSGMTGPQHPFYNRVSLHPSESLSTPLCYPTSLVSLQLHFSVPLPHWWVSPCTPLYPE